jgi:hypothetical protein
MQLKQLPLILNSFQCLFQEMLQVTKMRIFIQDIIIGTLALERIYVLVNRELAPLMLLELIAVALQLVLAQERENMLILFLLQ